MTDLANLDKTDAPLEVIDNTLVTIGRPPFGGEVELPPSDNEPKWRSGQIQSEKFIGYQAFVSGKVNVTLKAQGSDWGVQPFSQVLNEAVNEVIRALVALMNKRIVTLDGVDIGIGFLQRSDVGIIAPKIRTGGPHIGKKIPRTAIVNGADSRGEHYDIAWALEIFKKKFSRHL